jgi:tetratricopeptide (TPR) repeat protein
VACLAAVAVVLAAYANSLDNAFQFDDSHVVEENLFIRNLANVPRFFTDATTFSALPANSTYRPLVTTSLAIDYRLGGGLEPRQFHVSQIAMLVMLGAMLVGVFSRTFNRVRPDPWNRYAALLAVLLLLVHTANTQTGNYISARSEIIAAMGVAGSFLLYQYAPGSHRFHLYVLPMVIGALGKVSAVTFAPLLFAYILFIEKRPAVRAVIPAFVVAVATFFFVESMNAEEATYGGGSRVSYALTQLFVWLHYGRLFVLPLGLTGDTDWTLVPHWYDTRVAAGVLFIGVLTVTAWKSARADAWRPVAFGLAWFAIALMPTSSIIPLAEVANEHRIFAPYMGLVLAAVWAGLEWSRKGRAGSARREVVVAAALMLVAAHAVGTHYRNKVWRTEETFWRDVVAKSPGNGRALMNYGLTQMAVGRYDEAKALFDRSAVPLPNYSTLEINRAIVTARLGDQRESERLFQRALALQPNSADAHFFYARWMTERDRASDAIPLLRRAIDLSAASIGARALLMKVYYAAGDDAALAALAESTLRIAPDEPTAAAFASGRVPIVAEDTTAAGYFRFGLAATGRQNHLDAALAYRYALRLDSASADYHHNLAWSRGQLGFFDLAVAGFEQTLRLRPSDVRARNNLAWARGEQAKRVSRPILR